MEFIQCPHCQKKYGVSDKLRRATGKRIRCKHCQNTFIIFIQEKISPEVQKQLDAQREARRLEEQQHLEPQILEAPEERAEEKPKEPVKELKQKRKGGKKKRKATKKTAKKPLNIQMVILIILATLLVAGASGTYLYFYNPELFEVKSEQMPAEATIKPFDPFAKKIKPEAAEIDQASPAEQNREPEDAKLSNSSEASSETAKKPKQKAATDGPDNPSQVCRDAAADYWIRTNMIANAMLTNEAYMKLLSQGISLTDEVRTRCKEKALVGRLADSARSEDLPEWIKKEVVARTSVKPAKNKKAASSGF